MTSTKELQLDFIRNNCSNTIMNLLLLSHGEAGSEEYKKNYYDLLKLPVISYWKNKIPTEINITTILGSSDSCFENSFGKLVSFGLSVNDILSPALQGKYVLFLDTDKSNDIYDSIARFVVAGYLYAADCSYDTVDKIITNRINTLYDFVTHSPIKYKIYIDSSNLKVPSQYKSKQLVNPVLYEHGELILPLIHDIFVFSHIYNKVSLDFKKKIDAIIDYIACKKYQSFEYGYGIIKGAHNKYHSMGWSAHLPLFNANLSSDYFEKGLLYRMALFSKFDNQNIQLRNMST